MARLGRRHDRAILDALEDRTPQSFSGTVWRVTGAGRDPVRGSVASGRWSPPGEFEVVYTSLVADGALSEIGYRLSLEPVWPSRAQYELHQMDVATSATLIVNELSELEQFGIDTARYQSFDYAETQALAAAAHFMSFDSMMVPSARSEAMHLVLFAEELPEGLQLIESRTVDWDEWRAERRQ